MINDDVDKGRSEGSVALFRDAHMDKTASNTRYAESRRSVNETTGGIRSGTQRLEGHSEGSLVKRSRQRRASRKYIMFCSWEAYRINESTEGVSRIRLSRSKCEAQRLAMCSEHGRQTHLEGPGLLRHAPIPIF